MALRIRGLNDSARFKSSSGHIRIRSSARSSLKQTNSALMAETVGPELKWVKTKQIHQIINTLIEKISELYLSSQTITDLNQSLNALKQLVLRENNRNIKSLSNMTRNFWNTWNDFTVTLDTALNLDQSDMILRFVKDQLNNAETVIRQTQSRINTALTEAKKPLPDSQYHDYIYEKFEAVKNTESIDDINSLLHHVKRIYTVVQKNFRLFFTSKSENAYVVNSIERTIKTLSLILNDDNLRDTIVGLYNSSHESLKKLVPLSNIQSRGGSIPSSAVSISQGRELNSSPNLFNQNQPNDQISTQTSKKSKKKKKKPQLPLFEDPVSIQQQNSSFKRSITPPAKRSRARKSFVPGVASINLIANEQINLLAFRSNNDLVQSSRPAKRRYRALNIDQQSNAPSEMSKSRSTNTMRTTSSDINFLSSNAGQSSSKPSKPKPKPIDRKNRWNILTKKPKKEKQHQKEEKPQEDKIDETPQTRKERFFADMPSENITIENSQMLSSILSSDFGDDEGDNEDIDFENEMISEPSASSSRSHRSKTTTQDKELEAQKTAKTDNKDASSTSSKRRHKTKQNTEPPKPDNKDASSTSSKHRHKSNPKQPKSSSDTTPQKSSSKQSPAPTPPKPAPAPVPAPAKKEYEYYSDDDAYYDDGYYDDYSGYYSDAKK